MADATDLQLSITANVNGLNVGLAQAQASVRSAARSMKTELGGGLGGASAASASLEGKIRALKNEMVSGDRTINFFARSLNGIVPEASAAGQGIRLLADGFIGGLGLGLAIQGVMAVLESFGEALREVSKEEEESAKKSKEAAEKRLKAYQDADRDWRRIKFVNAGGSPAAFDAQENTAKSVADVAQARADLDAATLRLAALRNSATGAAANPIDLANARKRVDDARDALALAEKTATRTVATGVATTDQQTFEEWRKEFDAQVAAEEKRIEARERKETESKKRIDKLWWDNFNAQVAAEQRLLDAMESLIGKEMSAFHENVLGGTPGLGNIKFAGDVEVPGVEESQRAAQMGAQIQAIDANATAAENRSQQLVTNIAATWASGLAEMVASTDFSAQNMTRIFVQMMSQIMAQALPAQLGPFGMIAGGLLGGLLGGRGKSARAGVASAAGGWWQVPGDTLAMIHKDEQVIPPRQAEGLRRLIEGGGGGGGMNVSIAAMDGVSVYRTLTARDGDVSRAMKRMQRRRRA